MEPKLERTPLIAIVGETASGKTATAIRLAKLINGEIICADSRTIYRGLSIGTAKPSLEEQAEVKHHLLDVIDPDEAFSAAEFKKLAQATALKIQKAGKIPIVVGGTGLYVDAFLYDFTFSNKPNSQIRAYLNGLSDEELTTLLSKKNINIKNLNTKNRRHVIRAIETGSQSASKKPLTENTLYLGLKIDREILKQRINDRVEQMFLDGFLNEVKKVSEQFGWHSEAMSGIGYRVAKEYFAGKADIDEVKQTFKKRDASLAKRQRTWFKRNPDIRWFEDQNSLIEAAVEFSRKFI